MIAREGLVLAYGAMLICIVGWSFGITGNKAVVADLGPAGLALVRFAAAVAALAVLLAARRELAELRRVGRLPFVLGIFEPAAASIISMWGLLYTSAMHGAVLWALMPIMAAVLGRIVLREPISLAVLAGAVLGIAGTALLFLGAAPGEFSWFGDLLILIAIFAACISQLVARRVATSVGRPLPTTTIQLAVGVLVAAAVAGPIGDFAVLADAPADAILIALALGLIGNAIPFFMYNLALQRLPVGRASLFVPLVGPGGAAVAALWLGEPLRPEVAAALVLMLVGAFLPAIGRRPA